MKTMAEKYASRMKDIARKKKNPTMPEKFEKQMKKISDDSKIMKPKPKPDSVKKQAKKAPVVTPKMIKDAGFTTLRDYMNFKQGKTRKDKKQPVRTEEFKKKNPAGAGMDMMKAGGPVKKMMGGGMLKPKKKMMGGGMTKGKMIKYKGGGIVKQGVRPTKYI